MKKSKLTELINSLNKGEIRNLKAHISRAAEDEAEGLKTVMLFDAIKKGKYEEFDEELVHHLYENGNKNAFYRLKNRLIHDIEQSLLLLSRNIDIRLQIYRTIELANIFRFKTQYETAFGYLKKAEKMVTKTNDSNLLDVIYQEILLLANDYPEIQPDTYIQKKATNRKKNKAARQVSYLLLSINHKLRKTNYSSKQENVVEDLNKIINQLSIDEEIISLPSVKFQVHECVRTVLLQNRNFDELENYLIDSFNRFEKEKLFVDPLYEKIFPLLSWILSVLTIQKKFEKSLHYVNRLYEYLSGNKKKYYDKHIWMYHQGLISNYSFLGKNKDAQELIIKIIENPKYTGHAYYDLYIYINHALSYYNMGEFDEAITCLRPLLTSKSEILSKSLRLRIALLELLLHTDGQNFVFAEHKVNEIRRVYRKELQEEQYYREKIFLGIVREFVCKPAPLTNTKFLKKIQEFIKNSPPFELGSNESINYKIWLQSKLEKRSYYELVLEEVNTKELKK